MQTEIYKRGPITCSISTPDDFTYEYRGGVFRGHTNTTVAEIDHDVEVVGWGTRDGVDYWIVRNSWGTFWGKLVGALRCQHSLACLGCAGLWLTVVPSILPDFAWASYQVLMRMRLARIHHFWVPYSGPSQPCSLLEHGHLMQLLYQTPETGPRGSCSPTVMSLLACVPVARPISQAGRVMQGFFEIERGINSLRIEGSDCWYAEPEFSMEDQVLSGKLQGSMYGVVDNSRAPKLSMA